MSAKPPCTRLARLLVRRDGDSILCQREVKRRRLRYSTPAQLIRDAFDLVPDYYPNRIQFCGYTCGDYSKWPPATLSLMYDDIKGEEWTVTVELLLGDVQHVVAYLFGAKSEEIESGARIEFSGGIISAAVITDDDGGGEELEVPTVSERELAAMTTAAEVM